VKHICEGETLEKRPFVDSSAKRSKKISSSEIKRHSFYLKPGEKRRAPKKHYQKRNRKKRPRFEIE